MSFLTLHSRCARKRLCVTSYIADYLHEIYTQHRERGRSKDKQIAKRTDRKMVVTHTHTHTKHTHTP